MGKASRRQSGRRERATTGPAAAPYVARPFEGLPAETEWVAIREIVPAATATVGLVGDALPEGAATEATICTVLPLAWPALHRTGGDVLVATQSGATSGDASRDLAAALLLALEAEEGTPVTQVPTPTAESPRLQDLVDAGRDFRVTVEDGFDFWVGDAELDDEGRASLERANESSIPTVRVEGVTSAYWCEITGRHYIRWVLPHDEDTATDALARLIAADTQRLVPDSRLLGAFRACGLLVPVWEVEVDAEPASFEDPIVALEKRLLEAAAETGSLDEAARRARAGLRSRQVTLR